MPEQATLGRTGLLTTKGAPVPLAGVSIDAELSTGCARVTVTQRYVNGESTPIEAVYVFPLDEAAAVCGFEALIDGALVVGEVREREEAFRMYDDAMERGDGAFLLDEERPDVFQASVGNLLPGKEVLLKLTYVTELAVADGQLRFSIPTTVSPRYAPASDCTGVGRPDSEALNPPVAWTVPYGLTLTTHVAMPGPIGRIESPSHPISVALDGERATVTLAQRDAALDRDFVLSIEVAGLDAPHAWVEQDDDGVESLAIVFAPRLPDAAAPAEVIFLVDRSGSMQGTSIEEVRRALQLCLRSMVSGCRFNIIGFGSTTAALFPESRAYDDASLEQAAALVATLEADLGGTEILPALGFALEQPRHAGLPRQIVVLTDGEVTNTDAVLALARQHSADARIFTFGIGAGASHHLVKGLARAGGGAAEFVYPGERIEPKVVRQFGRLLSPAITSVRVDWGGLDVTQAPQAVPPVFAPGRLILYGLLKSPRTSPATVRLMADGPSGPVAFDVRVDGGPAVRGRAVATLAARARIRELEESPEWTAARGSRQRVRKNEAVTAEIVRLSIRYGLMSRETSYVAIERRDTPVVGDVQLRRVPIALTAGWGGLDARHVAISRHGAPIPSRAFNADLFVASLSADVSFGDTMSSLYAMTRRPQSRLQREFDATRDWRALSSLRSWGSSTGEPEDGESASRLSARPSSSIVRGMHALVSLQRADGSWELTNDFARAIGQELRQLESAVADAKGDRREVGRVWATALAVAWLRDHAAEVEDEWRLLVSKAHEWLRIDCGVPPDGDAWLERATRFLRVD
jgi:Ca-activated chloride channel family protein